MVVTLTTDFGDGSSYVAAMKGAVLAVNPAARLLDLTHRLPPQDLTAAAYFLADALPWFPPETLHVVVVDPGVGTGRAILCVEWNGQVILVPDNGCWTPLLRAGDLPPRVYRLENRRFWRTQVSATFHGRDIFAPVAGYVTLGLQPAELGPLETEWVRLTLPQPEITADGVRGLVVIVDPFGNLVTNIPAAAILPSARVQLGGQPVPRHVRTYGDGEPGALIALIGSSGRLEVAVVNGSAAARLGLGTGTPVEVTRND
jgi:S-adenosyl-L-methionine hydrolase (adenosine-forming)